MSRVRMATPEGGQVSFEASGVTGMESVPEGTRILLSSEARLAHVRGKFTVEIGMDMVPVAVLVKKRSGYAIQNELQKATREG